MSLLQNVAQIFKTCEKRRHTFEILEKWGSEPNNYISACRCKRCKLHQLIVTPQHNMPPFIYSVPAFAWLKARRDEGFPVAEGIYTRSWEMTEGDAGLQFMTLLPIFFLTLLLLTLLCGLAHGAELSHRDELLLRVPENFALGGTMSPDDDRYTWRVLREGGVPLEEIVIFPTVIDQKEIYILSEGKLRHIESYAIYTDEKTKEKTLKLTLKGVFDGKGKFTLTGQFSDIADERIAIMEQFHKLQVLRVLDDAHITSEKDLENFARKNGWLK